jgi:threonine dehydratase
VTTVTASDVVAAAERLREYAVRTPTLRDPKLSALVGADVFVKCENLQVAGSFKFRGAFNRLAQLTSDERARGVVAWSAGNHAQGVAVAGKQLGIECTIVMPIDAPTVKIERTRNYGATVVLYDRYRESREEIATSIATKAGATIVPPFDDLDVIAGQGTVALELSQDVFSLDGGALDDVIVPCSGGGLLAGCAVALAEFDPGARIHAAEPEGYDSAGRSLRAGDQLALQPTTRSICDTLLSPFTGEVTWPIISRLVSEGLAVNDDDVLRAIRYAWRELRLAVEPGGAIALAALLRDPTQFAGRRVGVVVTGGNVDDNLFVRALNDV